MSKVSKFDLMSMLLADKDKLLADKDKLLTEKDKRLTEKDESIDLLKKCSNAVIAKFKHERDVARGHLNVRSMIEGILDDIGKSMVEAGFTVKDVSRTGILKSALAGGCPPLVQYLRDVAAHQRVSEAQLMKDVLDIYNILSKPTHAGIIKRPADDTQIPDTAGCGPDTPLSDKPAPVTFETEIVGSMKTPLLAIVSLARFTGRDVELYYDFGLRLDANEYAVPTPPAHRCQTV